MPLTSLDFVASLVRFRYSLPGCSPPVRITLERPAFGDFYFQAFNGSVSLSVAGYNYNSDWTPLLAGLSPAGMAASLAARSFMTDKFSASSDQCPLLPQERPKWCVAANDAKVESPGGISPPGAPRTVREPLDSHGSRCSAVAMP